MTILLCAALIGALATAGDELELGYIQQGLSILNLNPADLGYDKQWIADDFRLPVVRRLLNQPLETPGYVLAAGAQVKQVHQLADYIRYCGQELSGRTIARAGVRGRDLESAIRALLPAVNADLERAFAGLTAAQRESLLYTAPALWADEADSMIRGNAGCFQNEFGNRFGITDTLPMIELLRLSQKIDIAALHEAGARLAAGAEMLLPLILDYLPTHSPSAPTVPGVEGSVYGAFAVPEFGTVVIGGPERNVYQADFAVIIDAGGNDVYEGRCAAAIGMLGFPVSLVIDLAGDDVYRHESKIVNQGAAVFGAALLWDRAGNDHYQAYHIAQGAGLYGVGILVDEAGADDYRAGYFSQAAGNFGSGILIEKTGDDTYRADNWTQGMGGPWGYGLLLDDDGDDLYYAGGQYRHMPLDPDQFRSFSQGFGFGWRDIASGGIGFLYDLNGNDKYISEVYAQATSYWFALGMLLDEQGNDLYAAAQYAQGAGIHLSVGALLDREGDDHYFSRYGPAQGEGHDLSVGWLWDLDGDDVYYASGGQGVGLTNSVGIFIDDRGNDDYCSREALSQAGANPARGTGGIGLFIDLQGEDRYAEKDKGANNHVWTSGITACGMDLEVLEPKKEPWEDTTAVFPELDTMTSDSARIARLFYYASLWQVRADIGKVKTGRRLLRERYGPQAVRHVFRYEFKTFNSLAYEAIEPLFKAFKDTAAACLFEGLHATNDTIVRNSIYFLGRLEIKEAVDTLLSFLADSSRDTLAGALIVALGTIKDSRAVPAICRFYCHRLERTRLRVAVALADIKDTLAVPTLIRMLSDKSFLVKTAAREALGKIGAAALRALEVELAAAKTDTYRCDIIQCLRTVFRSLPDADKTTGVKKRLAEAVRPYFAAGYPALRDRARRLIDEVEGRSVLDPEQLLDWPGL